MTGLELKIKWREKVAQIAGSGQPAGTEKNDPAAKIRTPGRPDQVMPRRGLVEARRREEDGGPRTARRRPRDRKHSSKLAHRINPGSGAGLFYTFMLIFLV